MAVAVAIAVQALVALILRLPGAVELDGLIVAPILTTLVYVLVAYDADADPGGSTVWERFLERSWAVIVVDFMLSYVSAVGLGLAASGSAIDLLSGAGVILLSAALVFVDASAAIDGGVTVWSVVPSAFAHGFAAAMQRIVFPRACAIMLLQLLVFLAQNALAALLQNRHVSDASFWSQIPLATLAVPPLSALTALVYLDASKRRSQAGK